MEGPLVETRSTPGAEEATILRVDVVAAASPPDGPSITTPGPQSRPAWWMLAGLTAFFAITGALYVVKVINSERANRSAFLRWAGQLQELDAGVNIWERHLYPNPPIMAMILYPLTKLPPMTGAIIWFTLKSAMAVAALWWLLGALAASGRGLPLWGQILLVLLCLRPIQGDLIHGNVNLLILFLVTAGLTAFTHGKDLWAGLCLGLAIACKVTPALFVPYFLWKRQWRMVAATTVSVACFLLLAPAPWLGWQRNLDSLQSWVKAMVVPYAVEGKAVSEHQNQSLPGFLHRMLLREPSFADYDEQGKYYPVEFHNVADWDPRIVSGMTKGCLALFALAVFFWCRTPPSRDPASGRVDIRLWAEFSVVVLGMLIFSERTWKHHAVTLMLPFGVATFAMFDRSLAPRVRGFHAGAIALAAAFMITTATGASDSHDRFGKLAQVYGAYLWATLTLLISMFVVIRTRTNAALVETSPQGT